MRTFVMATSCALIGLWGVLHLYFGLPWTAIGGAGLGLGLFGLGFVVGRES